MSEKCGYLVIDSKRTEKLTHEDIRIGRNHQGKCNENEIVIWRDRCLNKEIKSWESWFISECQLAYKKV